MTTAAWAPEGLGEVRLHVPNDWLDLLEDGDDEAAAAARIAELLRLSYPSQPVATRALFADAVLAWRRSLLGEGTLMHGIVCVPPDEEFPAGAAWQVMAGVVEVPRADADLDLAVVLSRLMGDEFAGVHADTGTYTTSMGLGLGCVARPAIDGNGRMLSDAEAEVETAAQGAPARRIGLGIALSCPPGGGPGLLVVGSCLDPEQTVALGSLVAVIAGGSHIHPDSPPTQAS